MGKQSRRHGERRKLRKDAAGPHTRRAIELQDEISRLFDGDVCFSGMQGATPDDQAETNLEDILKFESVGSGQSLFEGLQENGLDLPHPDRLDDEQSFLKSVQVMHALEELHIFLIGFDDMSPRELYATLWNETLWEGCYVKKRVPGAGTIIDVSHKMPRSELLAFLDKFAKRNAIQ